MNSSGIQINSIQNFIITGIPTCELTITFL